MSTMAETLKNDEALFIPSDNGTTETREYLIRRDNGQYYDRYIKERRSSVYTKR